MADPSGTPLDLPALRKLAAKVGPWSEGGRWLAKVDAQLRETTSRHKSWRAAKLLRALVRLLTEELARRDAALTQAHTTLRAVEALTHDADGHRCSIGTQAAAFHLMKILGKIRHEARAAMRGEEGTEVSNPARYDDTCRACAHRRLLLTPAPQGTPPA